MPGVGVGVHVRGLDGDRGEAGPAYPVDHLRAADERDVVSGRGEHPRDAEAGGHVAAAVEAGPQESGHGAALSATSDVRFGGIDISTTRVASQNADRGDQGWIGGLSGRVNSPARPLRGGADRPDYRLDHDVFALLPRRFHDARSVPVGGHCWQCPLWTVRAGRRGLGTVASGQAQRHDGRRDRPRRAELCRPPWTAAATRPTSAAASRRPTRSWSSRPSTTTATPVA